MNLSRQLNRARNWWQGRGCRRREALRPHFWQTLANLWEQGFGFIFSVVLAHLLAPEQFGEFVFATAAMQLAFIPFNFSSDQVLVSKGTDESMFAKALSFAYFVVGLRLLTVVGVVLFFFLNGRPVGGWICAICGIPEAVAPIGAVLRSDLEGSGTFSQNLLARVASSVLSFVAVMTAVFLGAGVFALTLPCWAWTLCILIIYRIYSRKPMIVIPRLVHLKDMGRWSIGLWINNAAETAIQRMDKWFVGRVGGTETLGYYNRAFTFTPVSHLILNSLLTNPSVSVLARRPPRERLRYLMKIFVITVLGGIVSMAFYLLFANPVIVWVFGRQWTESVPFFRAMSGLSLCYAVLYVPVVFLFALKRYFTAGIVRFLAATALWVFLVLYRREISPLQICYAMQLTILAAGLVLWGAVIAAIRQPIPAESEG